MKPHPATSTTSAPSSFRVADSQVSLAVSIAHEALASLPGDGAHEEAEAAAREAVRAEARRREGVLAQVRAALLTVAVLSLAAAAAGSPGSTLRDDRLLAFLLAWGVAAWALVWQLRRGWHPRSLRLVLPATDALGLAATFALLTGSGPPPTNLTVAAGVVAVLLALLGPARLSRSGTRVATAGALFLWAAVVVLGDVPPVPALAGAAVIAIAAYLGLQLTQGARHLIAEQVRSARLRSLVDVAEEGLKARQQILGVVCHDLRNPLATIASTADLILEIPLGEEERSAHLRVVKRMTEHMDRLVHDLLDVARMEAGTLTVEPTPCEVRRLLASTEELMRPIVEEAGLEFVVRGGGGVDRVMADPERIQQLLSNLVGNAVKFTPKGGRVVVEVSRAGSQARVSVHDTGPGIRPEDLQRLWRRLWQAEPGDRRGMGLGLTIARAIAEAHGGEIGVDSTMGAGSTFWFTLPLPPRRPPRPT